VDGGERLLVAVGGAGVYGPGEGEARRPQLAADRQRASAHIVKMPFFIISSRRLAIVVFPEKTEAYGARPIP
jgi:hypothetical protein